MYCELSPTKNALVYLQAPNQLQNFSPDLWFLNPDKKRVNLSVTVDGKQVVKSPMAGQQARLALPNLKKGNHQLHLNPAHYGRWLLNNTPKCSGRRYLKRRIFKLKPRLRFMYQHTGEDAVLSARLYRALGEQKRSQIKVTLKAVNPQTLINKKVFKKWTFKQRLYDIRAIEGEESILLYASKSLSAGESFLFRLITI
ncbi:MAG: hypothetical protein Q9M50_02305 [Methylococcales bacterium]|nr:hypothetical protein [Methylococcales bacterium]